MSGSLMSRLMNAIRRTPAPAASPSATSNCKPASLSSSAAAPPLSTSQTPLPAQAAQNTQNYFEHRGLTAAQNNAFNQQMQNAFRKVNIIHEYVENVPSDEDQVIISLLATNYVRNVHFQRCMFV